MLINKHKIVIKSIAVLFITAMLFSCSKNIEQVNRLYQENEDIPAAETRNFKLTYTLKGNRVLVLSAPLMLDFTHQKNFKYQYFPQHITIEIFNENRNEKTIITADKAFVYKNPDLSELIGNVNIIGADGSSLKTNHLYWDATNQHIFGEGKTVLKQKDEQISGVGFDSSLDFKNVRLNKITGIIKIDESRKNN
jgi:LPS export ABC transporter protein LptC